MTPLAPEVWADSAVSLAAALGLVIVLRRMAFSREDPLARRFLWSLGLLAALMLARVAGWTTGLGLFAGLTVALAARCRWPPCWWPRGCCAATRRRC